MDRVPGGVMREVLTYLKFGWIAVYVYLAVSPCHGQCLAVGGTAAVEAPCSGSVLMSNGAGNASWVTLSPPPVDGALTIGSGDEQIVIGHGRIEIGQGDEKMTLGRYGAGWEMSHSAIATDGGDIPSPPTDKPKKGDSKMEFLAFIGFVASVAAVVGIVVVTIGAHCSAHEKIATLRHDVDEFKQQRVDAERIARATRLLNGDEATARAILEL